MNSTVENFRFTPKSGVERKQEVCKASFHILTDEQDNKRLHMFVQTTRPGETRDDRGVTGWDAPVEIDVSTGPFDLENTGVRSFQMDRSTSGEDVIDGFLYYWDHSSFISIDLTVEISAASWRITFNGLSERGDRVRFNATIDPQVLGR